MHFRVFFVDMCSQPQISLLAPPELHPPSFIVLGINFIKYNVYYIIKCLSVATFLKSFFFWFGFSTTLPICYTCCSWISPSCPLTFNLFVPLSPCVSRVDGV